VCPSVFCISRFYCLLYVYITLVSRRGIVFSFSLFLRVQCSVGSRSDVIQYGCFFSLKNVCTIFVNIIDFCDVLVDKFYPGIFRKTYGIWGLFKTGGNTIEKRYILKEKKHNLREVSKSRNQHKYHIIVTRNLVSLYD